MTRQVYFREGSTLAQIQCYAPGDGHLSFVAQNTKTSAADPEPPTEAECKAVCPYGWVLYQDGPNWRARPAE
jgi:hypothetical protein